MNQDAKGFLDIDPSRVRTLHRRVLVRIDQRAEKVGSLVLPPIAQGLPNEGTLIAVGKDARGVSDLVGRRVLLERYAHSDREALYLEGAYGPRYLVCEDEQVIGEIDGEVATVHRPVTVLRGEQAAVSQARAELDEVIARFQRDGEV